MSPVAEDVKVAAPPEADPETVMLLKILKRLDSLPIMPLSEVKPVCCQQGSYYYLKWGQSFVDKNYMITKTIFLILVSFQATADDWFCKEESSGRSGNTILACGVGESMTEDYARKRALHNAIEEFETICELSTDCRGKATIAESKRTTCEKENGHIKCYRLLQVTIVN